jgi:hypothetical protein
MTKKIQKHLLNQYIQDDSDHWLFKLQEQNVEITVYVYVTIFGFEVNYRKKIGGAENWKREDENLEPVQTLHRQTSFINAEAVRKLFVDRALESWNALEGTAEGKTGGMH